MPDIIPVNAHSVAAKVRRHLAALVARVAGGEYEVAWVLSRGVLEDGTCIELQLVAVNRSAPNHEQST